MEIVGEFWNKLLVKHPYLTETNRCICKMWSKTTNLNEVDHYLPVPIEIKFLPGKSLIKLIPLEQLLSSSILLYFIFYFIF